MIYTRNIEAHNVLVECDPSLAPAAGSVFNTLAELARPDMPLREGMRIRFGWSMLTLHREPSGLRVCEPDFSGDPLTQLHSTIDRTLAVLAAQLQWLRRVKEQGSDIRFDQHIVFTQAAFEADDLFALRNDPDSEADSGWSVAPVPNAGEEIDMSQLSAIPIYRLVDSDPELLSVLTLPPGYLVRLQQRHVVEITDPEGVVRWQSNNISAVGT